MSTIGQVHWHEGLFLQPHHLQTMARDHVESSSRERRLTWAYPYGVVDLRLSTDALENMLVRIDRLRAVMPSVQAEAETSSVLDFSSEDDQSPVASLSSISRSAVAASGTRSSASASTIKAKPSLVESE